MKLLVTGAWSPKNSQIDALESFGHQIVFMQNEKDSLPCSYEEVEGVICNGLFLYHDIKKFTSLKVIQLTSAGFDRVPIDYIKEKGITIYNAKGVYSVPMAEFSICGVLDLYKQSRFFAKNQAEHKWEKHRSLLELSGKTVAVIGCGNVGSECAKRFKAFDTTVLGVDLTKPENPYFDEFFIVQDIKTALEKADIVILTLPLTRKTEGMFNRDMFSYMKNNSILVNIARGAIVDETSLISALSDGKLMGAVLDVFCEEPLPQKSPLWDAPNVIITPHNSFVGEGTSARLFEVIKSNFENAI